MASMRALTICHLAQRRRHIATGAALVINATGRRGLEEDGAGSQRLGGVTWRIGRGLACRATRSRRLRAPLPAMRWRRHFCEFEL